jgi:hypothetical protein
MQTVPAVDAGPCVGVWPGVQFQPAGHFWPILQMVAGLQTSAVGMDGGGAVPGVVVHPIRQAANNSAMTRARMRFLQRPESGIERPPG